MKYVKFIGSHIFAFIIGFIAACGIGIAVAENIQSSTVDYNKNSQATVEDALDDLYEKSSNCKTDAKVGDNFALAIQNLYTEDGEHNLFYHDGTGTYGTYEAGDLSYRYAGPSASVNNYVCFGSDADTCPTANLYRIIGLVKDTNDNYQVKLIKASAADSSMLGTNGAYSSSTAYYWTSSNNSSNVWSGSALNTTNLNGNYIGYLNGINAKWVNYIDNHTWKVAGNTWAYIGTTAGAKNVYTREITNPSANTTYDAAIGLMYVSDYMYGASATFWANTKGYDSSGNDMRTAKTSNWLALGTTEWTIARRSDNTGGAFYVYSDGRVDIGSVYSFYYVARPVFYLKSSVYYNGGTGTSGDPYRISG